MPDADPLRETALHIVTHLMTSSHNAPAVIALLSRCCAARLDPDVVHVVFEDACKEIAGCRFLIPSGLDADWTRPDVFRRIAQLGRALDRVLSCARFLSEVSA